MVSQRNRAAAYSSIVVLPTYNECDNIRAIVTGLMAFDDIRVLVVDDASPDGTGALADQIAAEYPGRIDVMHRKGKRGLGRSYIDGITAALKMPVDVVCQMDADFSHDPVHLLDLIAATGEADVAIGSRYVPGGSIVNWPPSRRLLSRFANMYIRAVTGLRVHDCTSGYRCWRRSALSKLPFEAFTSDGYAFLVEMLFAAASNEAHFAEVPIRFVERRAGRSKLSYRILFESAMTPWSLIARGAGVWVRARRG